MEEDTEEPEFEISPTGPRRSGCSLAGEFLSTRDSLWPFVGFGAAMSYEEVGVWLVTWAAKAGPPLLFTVYAALLRSRPMSQLLGLAMTPVPW